MGVAHYDNVTEESPQLRLKILRYRARKAAQITPNPMLCLRLADALDRVGDAQQARLEYHEAAALFLRLGFTRKASSVYKLLLERFAGDDEARYGYEVARHECEQKTSSRTDVRASLLRLADGDDLDLSTDPDEPTLDPERRGAPRIAWAAATHVFDGQRILKCNSLNVSTTGLLVEADLDLTPGTEVQLSIGVPDQPWQGSARGEVISDGRTRTAVVIRRMDKLTLRHVIQRIAETLRVSPLVIRQLHREALKAL